MSKFPFKSKQYAVTKLEPRKDIESLVTVQDFNTMERPNIPTGIMCKCPECGKAIYTKLLLKNNKICDECGAYLSVSANERIHMIFDDEIEEYDSQLSTRDPLHFPGYFDKLITLQKNTGLSDGIVTGKGKIGGHTTMFGVMDSGFLMGSMGTVIGDKLVHLFEMALNECLPVVLFTASGGARMQEGILSLMQMARVSGAIARHSAAGLLYITVLTNPTTGGVTASFGMLGDIILSEPNALICFAGPRVIEQTIGQKLPEGFQRAEFLMEHGFIDKIVARNDLKQTLTQLLQFHLRIRS